MTFVDMHVKWSVTLTDPMNPEILTVLRPDQDGFKLFKIFNFIAIQVLLNLNRIQSILCAIPWSSDMPVLLLNQPSINIGGSCLGSYLNLLKVGVQGGSGIACC